MILHTIGDTSNSKFIMVVNRLLYSFIPHKFYSLIKIAVIFLFNVPKQFL